MRGTGHIVLAPRIAIRDGVFAVVVAMAISALVRDASADEFDDVSRATVRIHVAGVTDNGQSINNWGTGFFRNEKWKTYHCVPRGRKR